MLINEKEVALFGLFETTNILEAINKAKLTPIGSSERLATKKFFADEGHYSAYWNVYNKIMSKKWSPADASFFINYTVKDYTMADGSFKQNFGYLIKDKFSDDYNSKVPYTALDDLEATMSKQVDYNLIQTPKSTTPVPSEKSPSQTGITGWLIQQQDSFNKFTANFEAQKTEIWNKYRLPIIVGGGVIALVILANTFAPYAILLRRSAPVPKE